MSIQQMFFASLSSASGHVIAGSGLFQGSSDFLDFTPSSGSAETDFTLEMLVKLAKINSGDWLFSVDVSSNSFFFIYLNTDGTIIIKNQTSGSTNWEYTTVPVFRDPEAWVQLILSVGTGSNDVTLYANGTSVPLTANTTKGSSATCHINSAFSHEIGDRSNNSNSFDGYYARCSGIMGTKYTAASFGELTDSGFWQIKDISDLTFGANGWLLEGSNGLSNYPIATADMTGASAPSGDVTSSAANGDEPNWHAFDRNAATYWGASGVGGVATLTYQFDTSKTIASYSIQNRSGGTDGHPENWKIQGSNNGSSFTDLHTVTGQDFGTSAINYYTFNNTTAYTYYRLNISESQADAGPIVAEWAMYETQDTSGNGAGFIKTGTISSIKDSPTNSSDDGYGNYSIIDPLQKLNAIHTISDGNLKVVSGSAGSGYGYTSNISLPSSGVWEAEVTLTVQGGTGAFGIITPNFDQSAVGDVWGTTTGNVVSLTNGGTMGVDGSNVQTGLTSWSAGDKVICQADVDNGTIKFFLNTGSGYSQLGSTVTGRSSATMTGQVFWSASRSSTHTHDFGQNGFTLQGSSSKYLSTANLPTPAVPNYEDEYFIKANISHSNGSTTAVTLPKNVSGGAMVRIKRTNTTGDWICFDTARGVNKAIFWNATAAEDSSTYDDQNLTGTTFTMPSDLPSGSYLLECFFVGSYFAILEDEGDGQASRSINHGGGFLPAFIWRKNLEQASYNSVVFHKSVGTSAYLYGSSNAAQVTGEGTAGAWAGGTFTTSVIIVGSNNDTNKDNEDFISYLWADNGPYKFGSYVGAGRTGSDGDVQDGAFINVGGGPQSFFAKKLASSTIGWVHHARQYNDPVNANEADGFCALNDTRAVDSSTGTYGGVGGDFVSTGWKNYGGFTDMNESGATIIYGAFGIQPLTDGAVNQGRAR